LHQVRLRALIELTRIPAIPALDIGSLVADPAKYYQDLTTQIYA